jgi:hypothetical protein
MPPVKLGDKGGDEGLFQAKRLTKKESSYLSVRALLDFSPPALLGALPMPLAERALLHYFKPLHHLSHSHKIIPICEVGNWNGCLC